ncbi:hypothetical protein EV177_007111, partial [Coemansia sp. RSA 1804]
VALAFGKSSSTIHASAYGQPSPWEELGAQAAKPQTSIINGNNISVRGLAKQQQQQQQAPIQPSYYNARLNPIRCAAVQRTAYHGVYEGVPYAEESSVKTLRQILRTRQDTASAPAAAAMTLPMTPVSSTISVEQAQALASWSTPSPDSVAFGQSRPGTSTSQDAEPHMPHSPQEDRIQHQHQQQLQQQQRPATSRDRRSAAIKVPPQQRPQTAAQKATADTKAQKRLTGWRDIHVKSLSRVDSILREAVGLGGARRERGSTYAQAPAAGARRASGLGISVGRGNGPGARLRPGTAHAALRGDRPAVHHPQSAASASESPYHDQTMYVFAAVPMIHRKKPGIASAHARPSTSSARLGASSESAYAYAYQNQPLTPADTPTRRMLQARRKTDNHRPSTHGWAEEDEDEEEDEDVNTGRRSMLLGANLPARLHTAAPTLDPQHSAASNGGARAMSMYMAGGQRPATAQGFHRQMSMYEAPGRPIQLSRDESRRSRLFAEYELLVASSTNDGADDDNDSDSHNVAGSNSSSTARPATAFAAAGSTALDDISEEAEEEEEQEQEDIATEYCGSPPEIIGGAVGLHPEEESDPAAPQRSSASAAAIASRRMRGVYSASMYATSTDLVSKKQSERRWSRIICQNQHLFTPQMVAAQIGSDAGGDGGDNLGEEPLLFDIEEVSCSDGEEASQTDMFPFGRRPLVTQSLVLDLPPPVDLFSDVAKALAERLPPPPQPPSAGSTASESSASTFAHRSDLLFSPEQPLSALPLSMPSQRQKTTASASASAAAGVARRPHHSPSPLLSNHEAGSDDAETDHPENQRDGVSDSRRTSASNGSAGGASEAASEQLAASTRSSIYIDADDILSSAIFATDELPYQQEQRKNSSDSAQLSATQPPSLSLSLSLSEIQPLVLGPAPIMSADHGDGDMMANSGCHRDSELLGAESAAMHANTDIHDTRSEADSSSSSTGGSGSGDGDSDGAAKADSGEEERGMRRSEYLRQQLDAVEGRTPATQLGLELSKGDRMHQELLEAYMRRFDFHEQPVDLALRQLFQQLRLPSESQQIDRVITSFAQRYDTCNPGLFRSADVVYAHAFAILLLHTDAHNPRIRHKISKQQFVAHARLLDDQAQANGQSEMFDEVLDILYDNITMVKFEYAPTDAPSAVGMLLSVAAGDAAAHSLRSSTSQLLPSSVLTESSRGDHAQSPGISGWLKRVFASGGGGSSIASNTPIRAPPLLAPLNIPSKAQYSYSAGTRRRVGSITSMAGVVGEHSGAAVASTPQLAALPAANRPSTAHGTFPRAAAQSRGRANTTDTPLFGAPQQTQSATTAGLNRPPHIDTASATFRSSPLAGAGGGGGGGGSSPSVDSTMSESPSSLCSPRSAAAVAGAAGIECSSSFSPTDIVVPAQPAMVETIRLSSLKSHVRRRVSLRKGRPLSGIIYGQEPHAEQSKQSLDSATAVGGGAGGYGDASPGSLDAAANAAAAAALLSGNALLRVDMAGRVSRKMERLDNGRRGLVRRWKDVWMVLSGSRLYLFRPNDAAHSATAAESPVGCAPMPVSPDTATPKPAVSIQSIIPLRNGVAVVDSAYTKYPHVFRILAGDGSEVLVKAPSDDAVAEWMARINCAAAFKSTEVERRTLAADPTGFPSALPETPVASTVGSEQRARLLESRIAALDARLNGIDDGLERSLRLFKQLASMVPLTRQGRTKTVHHANAVRRRLKDLYLSEQRLTCYKDVLELDLAIEYELATHIHHHHDHSHFGTDDE